VTIAGEPVTMTRLAPYLAPFELRPGILRHVVRHRCDHRCSITLDQDLPGGQWSHCPRYVLRSAWWRSIVALWQEQGISGKLDTGRLAAWAVYGVITLKGQVTKEAARGNRN